MDDDSDDDVPEGMGRMENASDRDASRNVCSIVMGSCIFMVFGMFGMFGVLQ